MLNLIDPIYTKLGFSARPDDSHLDIKLRKKAVRHLLLKIKTPKMVKITLKLMNEI